nr:choice-of-anchor M domain-containing protein [Patulibacter sp. SYSU D01012]
MALLAGAAPTAARSAAAERDAPAGRHVARDGHVDVGPRLVDGRWALQAHVDHDGRSAWHALDELVLEVGTAARTTLPADPAYRFLGRPGDRVWVLPQTQRPGVVWPGWNTQDPGVTARVRRPVTWTLHGVRGPDAAAARGFALFLNDGFGTPEVVFAGARPFPQRSTVAVDTHVHGNWAFPRPGAYALDVEMSAVLRDGTRVADRRLLRFAVGGADPDAAFAVGGDHEGADDAGRAAAGTDAGVPILLGALLVLAVVVVATGLRLRRVRGQA